MTELISLLPLDPEYHTGALQELYRATPHYWQMYNLAASPDGQAGRDMADATATPGRTMMGIVRHLDQAHPGGETVLIGLVDFRLRWPKADHAYLGMLMVAEPFQRRGIGLQAWGLLRPWLAQSAQISTVRLGVEQFNQKALHFFSALGFTMTGEANRIRVGEKLVRLLYMELSLISERGAHEPAQQ
jgi:RimJ/RimL family protein N-acetyltransferase